MRTVTLLEHESLEIGDKPNEKQLTVTEVEALDRGQRTMRVNAFRWIGRNRIKATQFVGMISTTKTRLEILPKIEGLNQDSTRSALIPMIAAAWNINVYDGEITSHKCQNSDLLELLIGIFARRLRDEIRKGLSHNYLQQSDDLPLLRGKLNVTRQFTRFAANPQFLACHYDEFSANNDLNQLLLCTTLCLRRISLHLDTQRLLSEIESHFEDVQTVLPSVALGKQISMNRSNSRWDTLSRLARLLLQSLYQTAHSGNNEGIALLFDMNLLFEAYIASVVRKTLTPEGYKVWVQQPQQSLAKDENGRRCFITKPDIYVEYNNIKTILDTKWKILNINSSNCGVAQADAYQMHGYAHVYGAKSTILIYPHNTKMNGRAGIKGCWKFESSDRSLTAVTVDLSQEMQIKEIIRQCVSYP